MKGTSENVAITYANLLKEVAVAANEAMGVEAALLSALQSICRVTGWPVGHALRNRSGGLDSTGIWHVDEAYRASGFVAFRRASEERGFASGVSLPGRVLAGGRPLEMTNFNEETNLIRKARNLKQDKKIDIPLAIAFSKIDAVTSMLDASSPLRFPSHHEQSQAFDLTDFKNVQSEIEVLIKDWSETGMTRTLQANYSSFGYFGVSSLGYNPDTDMKIKNLNPYRVADPFLWLLAEHKIINTKSRK